MDLLSWLRGGRRRQDIAAVRTTRIGGLEIMAADLGELTWADANEACRALGAGWRLPTRVELATLYDNRQAIGGFATGSNAYYWSSEAYAPNAVATRSIWIKGFSDGVEDSSYKGDPLCARAVRPARTASGTQDPPAAGGIDGAFECSRCGKTQGHAKAADRYAGDLWVCSGCGYKTARYD
jgi:hypothetical protein